MSTCAAPQASSSVLAGAAGSGRAWPVVPCVLPSAEESASAVASAVASAAASASAAAAASAPSPLPDVPPVPLERLRFDNRFVRHFASLGYIDESGVAGARTVPGAVASVVAPTPLSSPTLVCVSVRALALLGVCPRAALASPGAAAAALSGGVALAGAAPVANAYAGHQFGSFAGQLGDGAALSLGEVLGAGGARWELQLKGAGLTPYSRTADGRKVLRSSLREFLACEALAGLGIPTTRSASLVASGGAAPTAVSRDAAYDGRPADERCAVITRLAPTFLRFGSLELFKARDADTGRAGPSAGDARLRAALVDYVLDHFYASAADAAAPHADRVARMFAEICAGTGRLGAAWQAAGFVHGVLNTDNCSLLPWPRAGAAAAAATGTLDYGPFGFMERFRRDFVPNTSDTGGRYSFENQPHALRWNCARLGAALAPLMPAPAPGAADAAAAPCFSFAWGVIR